VMALCSVNTPSAPVSFRRVIAMRKKKYVFMAKKTGEVLLVDFGQLKLSELNDVIDCYVSVESRCIELKLSINWEFIGEL
jgi:hypothetical protein